MANFICYNYAGDVMYHIYQWDTNLTITIDDIPKVEGSTIYFHFCNRRSKTAYVVQPDVDGTSYTGLIPNELTAQPDTIFLYISENPELDVNAVITDIKIPVIPRVMPDDYIYQPPEGVIVYPVGLELRDGEIILVDANGNQIGDGVPYQGSSGMSVHVTIPLSNPYTGFVEADNFTIEQEW